MTTINIKKIDNIIKNKYKKFVNISDEKKKEMYNKIIKSKNINYEFSFLYNLINLDENIITNYLKKKKIKLIITNEIINDDKSYIELLNYNKIKVLSGGAYGKVFTGNKNKKKIVIKIQNFKKTKDLRWGSKDNTLIDYINEIINEYNIGKKLGKHLIGPKVYNIYFIYDKIKKDLYNIIEMEYLKGVTLAGYKSKHKLTDNEEKRLNNKIDKLHKLKIYHGDLHSNNILVIKKKKRITFYLIDYGFAKFEKKIINKLKKVNKEIGQPWNKKNEEFDIMKILIVNDIIINKDIDIIN